jgi:hypothetical protein
VILPGRKTRASKDGQTREGTKHLFRRLRLWRVTCPSH